MSQIPHVVIIGGGFGGLSAARALRKAPVKVTLLDRTNHHIFQPLLYQVATASLSTNDITAPIRWLLRKQKNTTVLLAEARRIDVDRRVVIIDDDQREIPYDYLILAAGTRHSYFGHNEWEPLAPGLKSIEDATEMRRRFLLAFENAEKSDDPAEQEAHLTFVVVGGGPTGVELSGVMPEVARYTLRSDFRRVDTGRARVLLLEGGDRVLATFPAELSTRAHQDLVRLGVEVRTRALVTRVEPDAVYVRKGDGEERIRTHTVFWAAGNAGAPVARSLGSTMDRAGRVKVLPDLSIPGHPEVFVIGDLASLEQDGKPVPGVAPAANQAGQAAAKNIERTLRNEAREAFRYVNKGNLAVLGRRKAVADFGFMRIAGWFAWWTWLFVHILYLVGFRNRLSVLLSWAYSYFTHQRGARLILDVEQRPMGQAVNAAQPITPWGENRPPSAASAAAPASASVPATAPATAAARGEDGAGMGGLSGLVHSAAAGDPSLMAEPLLAAGSGDKRS